MSKRTLVIVLLVVCAAILIWSFVEGSRIGAGVGAALLFIGILYGTFRTETSDEGFERAERGAREVREEIVEDEERRGTR